jgi:DNA-binding MarR family transcriptional regulator
MQKPMPPPSDPPKGKAACFYRAEGYKPEDSIGYLMRQILNTVGQEVERQLAHTELTNAQWIPLFKLYMGSASTAAELARECRLDAGAMTRLLDRLEAKGLLRRERSATDRRVITISLTDDGTAAAKEIPEVLSRVQNAYLADFSEPEFETLKIFLRRILRNANLSESNPSHDSTSP